MPPHTTVQYKRCPAVDFPSVQEPTERPSMTDVEERLNVLSKEKPFIYNSIILPTDSKLKYT